MDSAIEVRSFSISTHKEEEEWEEFARYKIEAMIASGNKNAKEAVMRFASWQRRRGLADKELFFRTGGHSDVLMRIQLRELSDLARMGIQKAVRALEEIREAKTARSKDIKKKVDQIHKQILGELSVS
jgi:hypothetical protein